MTAQLEILPPAGAGASTAIATGRDVVKRLAKLFPKHAAELTEWAESYVRVFADLSPADVAATFNRVLDGWTKSSPPRPAEFTSKHTRGGSTQRHPLYDARDPTNSKLFLARLGWWHRMRPYMGDEEAAAALLQARDEDEAYRVYEQWKHGERLDPHRAIPRTDPAIRDAAMAEIHTALEQLGRRAGALRGDAPPAPAQRQAERLRAAADAHHGDLMGVQQHQHQAEEPQLEEERI